MKKLKILCLGPQWRGSNAGGLFNALSRKGHVISVIDEFYEIPLNSFQLSSRVISRISRNTYIKSYNRKILNTSQEFEPDVILVYKGAFVLPDTLNKLKEQRKSLVNFYPDVSFHTHGDLLKRTLPLYDLIFTTKTFGIHDMKEQLGMTSSYFIPHGFDPLVHRTIDCHPLPEQYISEGSVIGGHSIKKENILLVLEF